MIRVCWWKQKASCTPVITDCDLLESTEDFVCGGICPSSKVLLFAGIFVKVIELQSLSKSYRDQMLNHLILVHVDPLLFCRPETSVQHCRLRWRAAVGRVWSSVESDSKASCQPVPRSACSWPPLMKPGTLASLPARSADQERSWFEKRSSGFLLPHHLSSML